MIRSRRRLGAAIVIASLALGALGLAAPAPAAAFSGFGQMTASEQYGQQMTFTVALSGGAPDRLELLLQFGPNPDSTYVAPVTASGGSATYTWDASTDYVTPNTSIQLPMARDDQRDCDAVHGRPRSSMPTTGRVSTGRAPPSVRPRSTGTGARSRRRGASDS